jgi:hypothetical protein
MERAFQELKHRICEEPVLKQPDQKEPFEVEVDASNYAIGAVLMQRDEKKVLHPVAFFSKTMNEAQRNYDVYNRELLGLLEMFRHWRPYLHQAAHKVKVHTDHANLYSGRTQENIIEEWRDGIRNLWTMTSNWYTSRERRMDGRCVI